MTLAMFFFLKIFDDNSDDDANTDDKDMRIKMREHTGSAQIKPPNI